MDEEEYNYIFVVEAVEPGADFLVSIVEKYNDEGLLAEKYPNHFYFYGNLTT